MAEGTSAEYARCLRLLLTAAIDIPAVTLIMCLSFRHGACLMSGHEQAVASKGVNRYVLLRKQDKFFGGGRLINCKVFLKLAFLKHVSTKIKRMSLAHAFKYYLGILYLVLKFRGWNMGLIFDTFISSLCSEYYLKCLPTHLFTDMA